MKIKILHKLFSGVLLIAVSAGFAQQYQPATEIRFRQGRSNIDPAFDENGIRLDSLRALLGWIYADSMLALQQVDIRSYASPEGGKTLNDRLSAARTSNMAAYLSQQTAVPDSVVHRLEGGIAWEQLRQQIEASQMPYRSEVLNLLDTSPEEIYRGGRLVDGRNHRLMNLRGGVPYQYMMRHFFPALRYSAVVVRYDRREVLPPEPEPVTEPEPVEEPRPVVVPETVIAVEPVVEEYERRPLFALKTNLLFDVALTPNIEIEVPIGSRWSINGEFMRGWWLRKQTFCWQLEAFGIEGRYWFGDRRVRRPLTGWFAGVFASGGFYDFQFHRTRGTQGEFYVLTGLSGGYGMAISRNWSLEFSAGIGYIINNYRRYTVVDNDYLIERGEERRFQSVFPAKAKISLVWLINRKVRKGGAL